MFSLLLLLIGLAYLAPRAIRALQELFVFLVVRRVPRLQHDFKQHGAWALVTGSSGIALGYARELAARKLNVVFLARREQLLRDVASELHKEFGVEVCFALQDFSQQVELAKLVKKLREALAPFSAGPDSDPLDLVGTVVNCIGQADDAEWRHGWSASADPNQLTAEIMNSNFFSYVATLAIFLPKFRDRPQGGVAINIASLCSYYSYPAITYATSKAALRAFVGGLRSELRYANSGVVVQTVNPGLVHTQLTRNFRRYERLMGVQPAEFAAGAITTVGWLDETAGILTHEIFTKCVLLPMQLLPERMLHTFYYHMVARARCTVDHRERNPAVPTP